MKVSILYFSQTGNTELVAEWMAGYFDELGIPALSVPIHTAAMMDLMHCDLLGIGTPCFNSRAPTPVMKWLRALEPTSGQACFVFATCGGAPGRVLHDIVHAMVSAGRRVIGGLVIRGEVYHPAPGFSGRFPGRPDAQDHKRVRRFIDSIVNVIHNDFEVSTGVEPIGRLHPSFYMYLSYLNSDRVARRMMPPPEVIEELCDGCGRCVEICPTKNIEVLSQVRFGGECIRCYHCLRSCPQEAIQIEWQFGSRLIESLYSPWMVQHFGDMQLGESMY